jgi:hypothetical protein
MMNVGVVWMFMTDFCVLMKMSMGLAAIPVNVMRVRVMHIMNMTVGMFQR